MPADYFVIAESGHDLQNPTSRAKLLELGARLRLHPGSEILDVGSGRGGPAILFATEFGCRVHGMELRADFHAAARARAADAGVGDRVSFVLANAAAVDLPEASYDVVLCLGATFVWQGLGGTLDALEPVVRPGGNVVIGEPYWRRLPLPEAYEGRDAPYTTLEGTVDVIESGDLRVVAVIASSEDDWDRYETLHWQATEEWLAANGGDPEASEIARRHEHFKRTYLHYGRDYLGWALFVASKPAR
jgi:SAM-dependent methyltransferase